MSRLEHERVLNKVNSPFRGDVPSLGAETVYNARVHKEKGGFKSMFIAPKGRRTSPVYKVSFTTP